MDPLTQGLLGAAAAQALYGRTLPRSAWAVGFMGGVIADLDVLIRFEADPILSLIMHRHFTHALVFIPIGGLVAGLAWLALTLFRGYREEGGRQAVLAAATVGYATHALLDACTSYGTLLWWPFSHQRAAWDIISVIDPIFTLVLLVGVAWAAIARHRRAAVIALLLAGAYLGLGVVQRERAEAMQQQLIEQRGHDLVPGRRRVMPTLGNLVLWRAMYETTDGLMFADAIRVVPWDWKGGVTWREGGSLPVFPLGEVETGDAYTDITLRRYAWFADDWLALAPARPDVIADMRYARNPSGFDAIWGVRVKEHTIVPVSLESSRENLWFDLRQRWQDVLTGFQTEEEPQMDTDERR